MKRAGTDVTIVGLAYYVGEALAVAEALAGEGISVEVVDPRTLVPMDVDTLRASVRKTGRLVIVDHGTQTFSLYGNLKDVALAKGATVARGDLIGMVGVAATGATGLYFELRVDGRQVDPLQWLRNR